MKLTLKNIAKVRSAEIELNGITVIAGENNTGKSTVGKALYSVFNSLYNIESQIYEERIESVSNAMESLYIGYRGYLLNEDLSKVIVDRYRCGKNDYDYIRNELREALSSNQESIISNDKGELEETTRRIKDILDVSDEDIFRNVIAKKLNAEFNGQINNVYTDEHSTIKLCIKDTVTTIVVSENDVCKVENAYSLKTEAVYIDDPFVIDEVRGTLYRNLGNYVNHKNHIRKKLLSNNHKTSVIDEIIINNKLDKVYSKINSVCNGNVISNKRAVLGYKKEGTNKVLNIKNISTGLKTFVILKMLLENGTIEHNGMIILDEPEIHLHPQWQLLFAELIVLIQKEFNMHILLNTHSPYFMKAIEVYASKYEIANKCNYYLAHTDNAWAIIDDVTHSTEEIYKLLARPLQELENVRYEND